ncbi:MAG: hypothetical protein IT434_18445 [Phycisphaerales bacterium]|nr:hypothetical protein [Phycisphaerales bacterium]
MTAPAVERAGDHGHPVTECHADVWAVRLDGRAGEGSLEILSAAEREHSARLRMGGVEWGAARAALRRILGDCLAMAPCDVAFEAGGSGKLRLAPGAPLDLRFSVSRSGGFALIALRLSAEVGVDLEPVREGVRGAEIARDILGEELGGGDFFRLWTRREALAKACGRGIASPLRDEDRARFTVRDCDVLPGFAAAVASEGRDWDIRMRRAD